MKIETIIKRCIKKGYKKLELEAPDDILEIQNIIKWLYFDHNIFIHATYCAHNVPIIKPNPKNRFWGCWKYNIGSEYSDSFSTERTYKDVYVAYFEAVKNVTNGSYFKYNIR